MLYCPPNITFSQIWINHGISHCFMDTVGTSVYGGFIIIFGLIQLYMYRKYATRVSSPLLLVKSRLYGLQMFLLCLFPMLQLVRFILNARIYADSVVYGYMVSFNSNFFFLLLNFYFCFHISDSFYCFNMCLLYIFYLFGAQREELYVTIVTYTRSWLSVVTILDIGFY